MTKPYRRWNRRNYKERRVVFFDEFIEDRTLCEGVWVWAGEEKMGELSVPRTFL